MSSGLTLGSLFDGSGGFPLAGVINGITPVWASEIEAFPVKVTKARFPDMRQLGDITLIDGGKIEPVDIITGGSPCQDLSVAGTQAGIVEGSRSKLFFEMIRVIKEMRNATDGAKPRWVVWENVPGAFSSNKGEDFRCVLEAFCKIADEGVSIPRPARGGGKWTTAGAIMGDGFSVAWRTLDAQYWGVPQRRHRIFLVADFSSERAEEVPFERKSLLGDDAQGDKAQKGNAADVEGSVGGSGGVRCLNPWDTQTIRQYDANGVYPALSANATGGLNRQGVVYPTTVGALCARADSSPCVDRGQPFVAMFSGGQGEKARSIGYSEDTAPTLKSVLSGGNTVPDVVYTIEGNTIDRESNKNGSGYSEGVAPTLNTQDKHAVAFSYDCRNHVLNEELSATLQAKQEGGYSLNYVNPILCMASSSANAEIMVDKAPTLTCMYDTMQTVYRAPNDQAKRRKYIVRRLMPVECARLQGFPDWWDADVEASDSARYKMWGNGIALPCAVFVLAGIVKLARRSIEGAAITEGADQHE